MSLFVDRDGQGGIGSNAGSVAIPLFEKYRSAGWEDVAGQEEVIRKLRMLARNGLAGRAFWIRGKSGAGKTTIARLIAAEVADNFATYEIDGQDITLEMVREFEGICRTKPLGGKVHAFIINEAHGMLGRTVTRLLTTLEERSVQRNSTWIFTQTVAGEKGWLFTKMDVKPFLSRCIELDLGDNPESLEARALRCQMIARQENLDGKPLDDYLRLIQSCDGNMREALQKIESGCMC